uniref:Ovule protein n=1 Tax=Taenia asiatica TaxID=60517 RepID=A0A0R3WAP3_TAEAS
MPNQPKVIISLQINRRLLLPRSLSPFPLFYSLQCTLLKNALSSHFFHSSLPDQTRIRFAIFLFFHFEVVIYFMYKLVYFGLINYKVVASLACLPRFLSASCYG